VNQGVALGLRAVSADAVKPGIHRARTHWIRGFMALVRERAGRGTRADGA